jgi:hypothetical protein
VSCCEFAIVVQKTNQQLDTWDDLR